MQIKCIIMYTHTSTPYVFMCVSVCKLLNQPHTSQNDHKEASRNHTTCQNLNNHSCKLKCKKGSRAHTLLPFMCAMEIKI